MLSTSFARSLKNVKASLRLMILRDLNGICTLIDEVAYRPIVVKLTERLPQWWSRQLAHLSMKLDDRWGAGYWESNAAPAAPNGPCEACGRRAAWLVIGATEPDYGDDQDDVPDFLELHPIQVCGWCKPNFPSRPRGRADVDRALAEARALSVSWRWRWHLE
jgi:hypothetical protein